VARPISRPNTRHSSDVDRSPTSSAAGVGLLLDLEQDAPKSPEALAGALIAEKAQRKRFTL